MNQSVTWSIVIMVGILLVAVSIVIYYIKRKNECKERDTITFFPMNKLAIIPIFFLSMCGTAPITDPPAHANVSQEILF